MNDAILAEQWKKTGNLMDLLNDEAWVREADAEGAEDEGMVEAGPALRTYVELIENASPEALQRQRWFLRVLSILLPELKGLLESWQLGRSFEAVYMEVQQRLYGHLKNLTPEQTDWIEALLAEKEQALPDGQRVIRAQAVSMLAQMFTSEDWQAIADVAAQTMAHDILQMGKRAAVSTVNV
jgi:ABC-type multidrug transport system fused ATPase/permease subunit